MLMSTALASATGCHGVVMPARIGAGDTELQLRGMGLREATWLDVDVYVAGLYLPAGARVAAAALAPETAKQMRLQLLRDVSREEMAGNIEAGFRKAAGSRFAQHRAALDVLLAMIPPLSEGESFILDYRPRADDPGGVLQLWHGSRVLGGLSGGDFGRTLFAIWLGDAPLSAALKSALLGGPCNG